MNFDMGFEDNMQPADASIAFGSQTKRTHEATLSVRAAPCTDDDDDDNDARDIAGVNETAIK